MSLNARSARGVRASAIAAVALAGSIAGRARADSPPATSPLPTPDDKAACVAATDQAQTLRDDGKYKAARAAMLTCARDVCPAIVRRDCEKWLGELDAAQPTLVLGARDPSGNDFPGTRVLIDGAPLVEHLDGKPVPVDPGEHVLRYEAAGAAPVEQRVVVRVSEKNRTLTAILMPQSSPPAPVAAPPAEKPDRNAWYAAVPMATWVLAGVAVVAAGSFAGFGLSGQADVSNMRATCAPNCTEGQVDSARTKLIVADASLGVGVVSLAAAAWFFFRRDREPGRATGARLEVEPRRGGGVATVGVRF
jgi:hypothetical protein